MGSIPIARSLFAVKTETQIADSMEFFNKPHLLSKRVTHVADQSAIHKPSRGPIFVLLS